MCARLKEIQLIHLVKKLIELSFLVDGKAMFLGRSQQMVQPPLRRWHQNASSQRFQLIHADASQEFGVTGHFYALWRLARRGALITKVFYFSSLSTATSNCRRSSARLQFLHRFSGSRWSGQVETDPLPARESLDFRDDSVRITGPQLAARAIDDQVKLLQNDRADQRVLAIGLDDGGKDRAATA